MDGKKIRNYALEKKPLRVLENWVLESRAKGSRFSDAMTLATLGESGRVEARVVLLKGIDHKRGGLRFFTNYQSPKSIALLKTKQASTVFFWENLNRQIRVEGSVKKLSAAESSNYFASRPRESQIGAWASPQSEILPLDRKTLASRYSEWEERFERMKNIPRPPHWGGFILIARSVELWIGQEARLHDRFLFTRNGPANWNIQRLAP